MEDKSVYVKEGGGSRRERPSRRRDAMGGLPATAEVGVSLPPSLHCWLRSTGRHWWRSGWHSTPTPGTSCVSLSSLHSPTLLPIPAGVEGKAWALPTQAAPMPRVESASLQRTPGRGRSCG